MLQTQLASCTATMRGHTTTSILIFIIAVHTTNALGSGAMKVLHFPEKILGGVIDMVQSHKNKPAQQTFQSQNQQQSQQGYGWNSGSQAQNQNQAQYQYGNYGYPQTGSYPQGGYVNSGQVTGSGYQLNGGSQAQTQGQYQNYPQNQSGFQFQNQQASGQQSNQFQNQVQNGYQGQQNQIQIQNQVNGQFPNQNPQTNLNFQGTQHVINLPVEQNKPSGSYGSNHHSGTYVLGQLSGNYGGQEQASNHYVLPNQPQGQLTQSTSFVGQNHQSTQFQTGSGSYGGTQGFQTSTGPHSGIPGPTCVCQSFTKPKIDGLNDVPSQRNEEKTEKPVENEIIS